MNQQACTSLGYSREELVGMNVTDVETDFDLAKAQAVWSQLRPGEPFTLRGHQRRKNGQVFPVEVRFGCFELEGRRHYLGVVRDITERERTDRHIRHLNRVYAVLSDINQTIVRLKDKEAVLAAACQIAVEKGGFLMAWIGLIEPDSKRLKIRAQAGADSDTLDIVDSLIKSGGCQFTQAALENGRPSVCNNIGSLPGNVSWREEALKRNYRALGVFPLKNAGDVVGVFAIYAGEQGFFDEGELRLLDELAMDISFALVVYERDVQRIRAENELRLAEDRFRQAQKMEAVGQLAGGVAHDFNNILAAIILQVEWLSAHEEAPKEVREGLMEIHAAAGRAANLTRQLLLFSRRQVMQSTDLDLNEVVTSLTNMLQRIIGEDVSLQLNLHPCPLITHADAGMLDQVLMNLAVNARDAMPGGGKLRISTSEAVVDESVAGHHPDGIPGRYACLSVADTGGGIPAEVMPRIFEPFFTTKAAGKGTGLGLSTVFGIVKQHRGWIKVENQHPMGARFQIFLPAVDVQAEVATTPKTPDEPRGGTETILLAEDDPAVRRVTRTVLERAGYHVLGAGTGEEARRIWAEYTGPIHLLYTDIVMPAGTSGLELAAQLREQRPQLRVVFTSGYSADIAGHELSLQPGQDFIQKPASQIQLLQVVRQCLEA